LRAARASRVESAAVVVVRRGRTPPLTPPPCVGARFPTLAAGFLGAARASRVESAAVVVVRRGRTPPLTPPPCVGARFPTLAAGSCSRIALCLIALRSRRCSQSCRRLRRICRNVKRCSAISSCTQLAAGPGARCARAICVGRSAARTSRIRRYPVRRADSSAGVTNRYPTLRTVPMTDSYSGPSLARSRRTCTSTVRVPP
jgi:hypothetical protein